MIVLMEDTATPPQSVTLEGFRLRWDAVKQRCGDLGDLTDSERAARLGVSLATLYRWRKGTHAPDIVRAYSASRALGLDIEVMWERVAA